jgi:hypothetical protein
LLRAPSLDECHSSWASVAPEQVAIQQRERTCLALISPRGQLVGAALLAVSTVAVQAQSFPSKPIHLILPYVPGGIIDTAGRNLALRLTERRLPTRRFCRNICRVGKRARACTKVGRDVRRVCPPYAFASPPNREGLPLQAALPLSSRDPAKLA